MGHILAVILGLAAIGFISWWFFGHHQVATVAAHVQNQQQIVEVQVKGGYSPERVELQQGIPAILKFTRTDPSSCLDHVVFSDFGINEALPQNQTVSIPINTDKPGSYTWACGMDMFHGQLLIQSATPNGGK